MTTAVKRARPGRPRANTTTESASLTTREQLLDAAAFLFVTTGYSRCTTREIAARAGIRQASMYHHFASKTELLQVLMMSSILPSLATAQKLCTPRAVSEEPLATLYALIVADVRTLAALPHNAAVLYELPEVREHADFADFRRQREILTGIYADLAVRSCPTIPAQTAGILVMQLVESVIRLRDEHVFDPGDDHVIARACLGALMIDSARIQQAAQRAAALLTASG